MGQPRATYAENLLFELDSIAESYVAVLAASEIEYSRGESLWGHQFASGAIAMTRSK